MIEDGPSIIHGGMAFGAGIVAAHNAGATPVDPRPHAVGSIRDTFDRFPHIGPVLPAMGYSDAQLADLEVTIDATDCDCVITGTPIALGRMIDCRHPIRHATYALHQVGGPPLAEALASVISRATQP